MRDGLRLAVVALAHLWFWNREGEEGCQFLIYGERDLNTTALAGKRIKVTIELEEPRPNPVTKQPIPPLQIVMPKLKGGYGRNGRRR